MQILNGKEVSKYHNDLLKTQTSELAAQGHRPPGLAVVLIGDDPASQVYVAHKQKACAAVGFKSWLYKKASDFSKEDLKQLIQELNNNKEVDGILVQLPLPKSFDEDEVLSWIDPDKDPDALTVQNMGLLWKGQTNTTPCTPMGVMKILDYYKIDVAGKSAVVVGRSHIVGQPMAHLLQKANATVTVCHSKTPDISDYTKNADIVVVAAGKPGLLGKENFKKGAVVIDVGIHRQQIDGKSKLCGDVRFEELDSWVNAATPVPGGVGPMTIAMLLENTFKLYKKSL